MNRMRPIGLAVLALTATACERLPTDEEATASARAAAGEPVEKHFYSSSQQELEALDALGLIDFKSERSHLGQPVLEIALTEDGRSLGLEVDWAAPNWPWGPSGVKLARGVLCRLEFDRVTAVTENRSGPVDAADVVYAKRHVGHAPLYERLGASPVPIAPICDPAAAVEGSLVLVRREAGWATNRAPGWDGDWRAETRFDYDDRGLLIGAVTEIALEGRIVDLDGDAITEEGWSALKPRVVEGPGGTAAERKIELVETPFEASERTVSFRQEIHYGRPAGGQLQLHARDPWQAGGLKICVEGASMRC